MSTATLVSKTVEVAARGAMMQVYTATITTAAITTGGLAVEVVVIPGALANDQVFVNAGSGLAGLQIQGAKVTSTDTISVYMQNNGWATTLGTSTQLLDILIMKRGKGADTTSA